MIASWIFWRKCAVVYLILLSGLHSAPVRPHYAKIQSSSSSLATNSTVETSHFEDLEVGLDPHDVAKEPNAEFQSSSSSTANSVDEAGAIENLKEGGIHPLGIDLPSSSSSAPLDQLLTPHFSGEQNAGDSGLFDIEEGDEKDESQSSVFFVSKHHDECNESSNEDGQSKICGICLMDIEEFEKLPSFSMLYGNNGRCGSLHQCHLSCLNEWYKRSGKPTCPICLRPALFAEFNNAVKQGDLDNIRRMLDLDNFDANFQDCSGKTGLHYATNHRNITTRNEMVLLLKLKGGDPNVSDDSQLTPLNSARDNGFLSTVALLNDVDIEQARLIPDVAPQNRPDSTAVEANMRRNSPFVRSRDRCLFITNVAVCVIKAVCFLGIASALVLALGFRGGNQDTKESQDFLPSVSPTINRPPIKSFPQIDGGFIGFPIGNLVP